MDGPIIFRPSLNGNMPVGREPIHPIRLANRFYRLMLDGVMGKVQVVLFQLVIFLVTDGEFMRCMEMSGNGVLTGMEITQIIQFQIQVAPPWVISAFEEGGHG